MLSVHLDSLYEQRDQRGEWLASHSAAAGRLHRIEVELADLNRVLEGPPAGIERGRGPALNRPWLRDVPVQGRSLDVGLGR